MNSPMTTKELLALVGKVMPHGVMFPDHVERIYRDGRHVPMFIAAVEALPALCAQVEAADELANMIRKQRDTFFDEMDRQRIRADAAEAEVEALRKDAERLANVMAFLQSDSTAVTYQSLGQYRRAAMEYAK